MRRFATALVFCMLAGSAAAQCSSPEALFKAGRSFLQELYSTSIQQTSQEPQPRPGAMVKTAAAAPATRMVQSAPPAKAQRARPQSDRSPKTAGLYAAIAVMAAIALRRRGR